MSEYDMRDGALHVMSGAVVERRKTIAVPLLLLVAGVAVSALNGASACSSGDVGPESVVKRRGNPAFARNVTCK